MPNLLLIGGNGFLGRHIAARLVGEGWRVTVPTRHPERSTALRLLPTIEIVAADVNDEATLRELVVGADAVVNLVGVLHSPSGSPWGPAFEAAHVRLPRAIVAACDASGIARLIHLSALGATPDAPSEYLRSKAAGEQAVRAAATPWTILRPSVVFGRDDRFLNLFATLTRFAPVVPLAGAHARLQPVFVGDVARAVSDCLLSTEAEGACHELAGPRVYTLRELVAYVAKIKRRRRLVVPMPDGVAGLQAALLELLPGPLMSRDNLRSLEVPNVASGAPLPFGRQPVPLEAVVPSWLAPKY